MLEKNWKFAKGDFTGAEKIVFDDSKWGISSHSARLGYLWIFLPYA